MPGIVASEFENPLRLQDGRVRVIDLFLDIILPELVSRQRMPTPIVRDEHLDLILEDAFSDAEARYVTEWARRELLPSLALPTGGELPDVTWAFNQATGARPEQWEVDETPPNQRDIDPVSGASLPVDPLTGQLVFPINPRLPSLNRHPGIIFVPTGWFPIVGTITLFGGQQIVGVAADEGGTVLVKYGDGACIRTQAPMDLASDRHITAARAEARLPSTDRLTALRPSLAARWAQMLQLSTAPPEWLPPGNLAGGLDPSTVRLEEAQQSLMTAEFRGFSVVRLSSLLIRQRDCWGPSSGSRPAATTASPCWPPARRWTRCHRRQPRWGGRRTAPREPAEPFRRRPVCALGASRAR